MTMPRPVDPELTLVIPTLGRALLRDVLQSVMTGSRWPAQVVIVDQGRKPDIAAIAAEMQEGGLQVTWLP